MDPPAKKQPERYLPSFTSYCNLKMLLNVMLRNSALRYSFFVPSAEFS